MPFKLFINNKEGGIKGTIWTIGIVVLIVFVILALFIIAPDLVYAVVYRIADFVLGNYGI